MKNARTAPSLTGKGGIVSMVYTRTLREAEVVGGIGGVDRVVESHGTQGELVRQSLASWEPRQDGVHAAHR